MLQSKYGMAANWGINWLSQLSSILAKQSLKLLNKHIEEIFLKHIFSTKILKHIMTKLIYRSYLWWDCDGVITELEGAGTVAEGIILYIYRSYLWLWFVMFGNLSH